MHRIGNPNDLARSNDLLGEILVGEMPAPLLWT
jgi:hypothetical protein